MPVVRLPLDNVILILRSVLQRRRHALLFAVTCKREIPLKLLDPQVPQVLVPEKIFLGAVHEIHVFCHPVCCALHSVFLARHKHGWSELDRACTTDNVETHQTIVSHAEPHCPTLEKVLDSVLLCVQEKPLLGF